MKTFITLILLTLAPSLFGAAIPGTVVSAKITTGNDANTFSIGDSVEMKGTPKSVADVTARNAIPAERRAQGMDCWVIADAMMYRLIGGTNNSDWQVVAGTAPGSATNALSAIRVNGVLVSGVVTQLNLAGGLGTTWRSTNSSGSVSIGAYIERESIPITDFGAVGTADDFATFQAAANSGQSVYLSNRTYTSSPFMMSNGTELKLKGSTIQLAASATTGTLISYPTNATNISIIGPGTLFGNGTPVLFNPDGSTSGTRNGAYVNMDTDGGRFVNIKVKGFSGYGVQTFGNTNSAIVYRVPKMQFSSVEASENSIGIWLGSEATGNNVSEYWEAHDLWAHNNEIGVKLQCGNGTVTGSRVTTNHIGIWSGFAPNGGHGSWVGGSINHNRVMVFGYANFTGWLFRGALFVTGGQSDYSDIYMTQSSRFTFEDCYFNIGSMTFIGNPATQDGNYFRNNHYTGLWSSIAITNSGNLIFQGNISHDNYGDSDGTVFFLTNAVGSIEIVGSTASTNGTTVGNFKKINFTSGVTGYVATGVLNLGVSASGGGSDSTNHVTEGFGSISITNPGAGTITFSATNGTSTSQLRAPDIIQTNNVWKLPTNATAGVLVGYADGNGTNQIATVPLGSIGSSGNITDISNRLYQTQPFNPSNTWLVFLGDSIAADSIYNYADDIISNSAAFPQWQGVRFFTNLAVASIGFDNQTTAFSNMMSLLPVTATNGTNVIVSMEFGGNDINGEPEYTNYYPKNETFCRFLKSRGYTVVRTTWAPFGVTSEHAHTVAWMFFNWMINSTNVDAVPDFFRVNPDNTDLTIYDLDTTHPNLKGRLLQAREWDRSVRLKAKPLLFDFARQGGGWDFRRGTNGALIARLGDDKNWNGVRSGPLPDHNGAPISVNTAFAGMSAGDGSSPALDLRTVAGASAPIVRIQDTNGNAKFLIYPDGSFDIVTSGNQSRIANGSLLMQTSDVNSDGQIQFINVNASPGGTNWGIGSSQSSGKFGIFTKPTAGSGVERFSIDSDGTARFLKDLLVTSRLRLMTTNTPPPTTGIGMELNYDSLVGHIDMRDRDTASFVGLSIEAMPLIINTNGGHVGIGTNAALSGSATLVIRDNGTNNRMSLWNAGTLVFYADSNGIPRDVNGNQYVTGAVATASATNLTIAIATNTFVSGAFYTNGSTPGWVQSIIAMTTAATTETAGFAIWIDQDGNGSFDYTNTLISVRHDDATAPLVIENGLLGAWLNPGAIFVFTNISSGASYGFTSIRNSQLVNFTGNSLSGTDSNSVRVVAGANVTVTPAGSGGIMTYTVASSGGGGSGFVALEFQTNNVRVGLQTNVNFLVSSNMLRFATNNTASNKVDLVMDTIQGITTNSSPIFYKLTVGQTSTPSAFLHVVGDNSVQALLRVSSTNGQTVLINTNGFIGINTNTPQAPIHVVATNSTGAALILEAPSGPRFTFKNVGGQRWDQLISVNDFLLYDNTAGVSALLVKAGTGRVGIGTTVPVTTLDVTGGVSAASAIFTNNVGIGIDPGTTAFSSSKSFDITAADKTGVSIANTFTATAPISANNSVGFSLINTVSPGSASIGQRMISGFVSTTRLLSSASGDNSLASLVGSQWYAVNDSSSSTLGTTKALSVLAGAGRAGGSNINAIAIEAGLYTSGGVGNGKIIHIVDKNDTAELNSQYGLYIENLAGGSTTNFAIFVAGTNDSYFGGGIGTRLTNWTADATGFVGYTNTTTYNQIWNVRGTSGNIVFRNRTGNLGSTRAGVAIWTNTIVASGSDIIIGVNCGIAIDTGVGVVGGGRAF